MWFGCCLPVMVVSQAYPRKAEICPGFPPHQAALRITRLAKYWPPWKTQVGKPGFSRAGQYSQKWQYWAILGNSYRTWHFILWLKHIFVKNTSLCCKTWLCNHNILDGVLLVSHLQHWQKKKIILHHFHLAIFLVPSSWSSESESELFTGDTSRWQSFTRIGKTSP